MKAALIRQAGESPVYAEFENPVALPGEHCIAVTAAALSPLVRARASGTHYSSSGQFPFVVGVDGVGTREDGQRVYFLLPRAPFGAMAERTVVAATQCIPVPDTIDDMTAAAIANPGMSSWAALRYRAHLKSGETVLINGATGASGQLAVKIARHLGAARVIATGRNRAILETLGADVAISLADDPDTLQRHFDAVFTDGVDAVIDYLWGSSAEQLLIAAAKKGAEGVPIRFVQVGNASGANITLPGAALRSSAIELRGSGIGSVSLPDLLLAIQGVFEAASSANLTLPVQPVPLGEVGQAWSSGEESRIVFTL